MCLLSHDIAGFVSWDCNPGSDIKDMLGIPNRSKGFDTHPASFEER